MSPSLFHPGIVGVAECGDTLLVFTESGATRPAPIPLAGRFARVEQILTGHFTVTSAPIGLPSARQYARRRRPIQAGYSLGTTHSVGSVGIAVVPHEGPANVMIMTAAHLVGSPHAALGAPALLQPAGPDGGRMSRDLVGRPFRTAWNLPSSQGEGDAVLVTLESGLEIDLSYPQIGSLRGHCTVVREGWTVCKAARSSGLVEGRIVSTAWSGFVDYSWGRRWLSRQVLIEGTGRVALAGDSGSVWVTPSGYAVALSFSATDAAGRFSIATPLDRLLDAFSVRVAVASAASPVASG